MSTAARSRTPCYSRPLGDTGPSYRIAWSVCVREWVRQPNIPTSPVVVVDKTISLRQPPSFETRTGISRMTTAKPLPPSLQLIKGRREQEDGVITTYYPPVSPAPLCFGTGGARAGPMGRGVGLKITDHGTHTRIEEIPYIARTPAPHGLASRAPWLALVG